MTLPSPLDWLVIAGLIIFLASIYGIASADAHFGRALWCAAGMIIGGVLLAVGMPL